MFSGIKKHNFKITDIKELCLQATENVDEEEWKKCVNDIKD